MAESTELADALQAIAKSLSENTKTLKELVISNEPHKKKTIEELQAEKPLQKIIYYYTQKESKDWRQSIWTNDKVFTNEKEAREHLVDNLKWKWRIINKSRYLSPKEKINDQ